MSIYGNLPPVNSEQARTQQKLDRVQRERTESAGAAASDATTDTNQEVDRLDTNTLDQAEALAQKVRDADSTSLHRLEDLRERIASGEYDADPVELAEILLPVLRGEHPLS